MGSDTPEGQGHEREVRTFREYALKKHLFYDVVNMFRLRQIRSGMYLNDRCVVV
jgi:hypothetical protein